MLSLRNRFGIPGVISVLALVFALAAGGAYAADGGSDGGATASAKKKNRAKKKKSKGVTVAQVRRIARQEARKFANSNPGPAGPVGLPGATGPQGPKGDKGDKGSNGSNGSNGTNGTNGESVTLAAAAGCPEGGTKLSVGAEEAEVCNGEPGDPWVAGEAPPGVVLKGTWSIQQAYTAAGAGEVIPIPISTGVPVKSGAAVKVMAAGAAANPADPTGCTGTAADPKVEIPASIPSSLFPTVVCLYPSAASVNLKSGNKTALTPSSTGGILAPLESAAAGSVSGYGSWGFEINPN